MAGQLWYLSENVILLSLFDREVDSATKRAMVKAAQLTDGDNEPLKRAVVDLSTVHQKTS
jgi:hypothetical protein